MLLKLSIIFIISTLVFLLLYISVPKKRKKRKTFIGLLSLIFLITSCVLFIIHIKSNNIKLFNKIKTYDVAVMYTAELTASGAESAYSYLPNKMLTDGTDFFFTNSKSDLFKIENNDGTISANTVYNKTSYFGGNGCITATLDTEKKLILNGHFKYTEYETITNYNNTVIARNVKYCSLTSNSLYYITEDNKLYGMGFNEYGQLGDTTTKNKSEPILIMENVLSADISDTHSLIVDTFGTLYAVGDNSYSQLGNKTAVSSTELITIMQGIKDVRVGNYFSLVLAVNGELYSAGINKKGQLANNGEEFKAELIPIMSSVDKIEINGNTCAALTYTGELYVWGDNTDSKAGVAQKDSIMSPVKISDNIYDFAISKNRIAVLTKDRDIKISNENGELTSVLTFNAQIPDIYKEKDILKEAFTTEEV